MVNATPANMELTLCDIMETFLLFLHLTYCYDERDAVSFSNGKEFRKNALASEDKLTRERRIKGR
jgi:hypothetical protein